MDRLVELELGLLLVQRPHRSQTPLERLSHCRGTRDRAGVVRRDTTHELRVARAVAEAVAIGRRGRERRHERRERHVRGRDAKVGRARVGHVVEQARTLLAWLEAATQTEQVAVDSLARDGELHVRGVRLERRLEELERFVGLRAHEVLIEHGLRPFV